MLLRSHKFQSHKISTEPKENPCCLYLLDWKWWLLPTATATPKPKQRVWEWALWPPLFSFWAEVSSSPLLRCNNLNTTRYVPYINPVIYLADPTVISLPFAYFLLYCTCDIPSVDHYNVVTTAPEISRARWYHGRGQLPFVTPWWWWWWCYREGP